VINKHSKFEFENGVLVKVDGRRHNYMDGNELLVLIRVMSGRMHDLQDALDEFRNFAWHNSDVRCAFGADNVIKKVDAALSKARGEKP
jgi:hypothetical protein